MSAKRLDKIHSGAVRSSVHYEKWHGAHQIRGSPPANNWGIKTRACFSCAFSRIWFNVLENREEVSRADDVCISMLVQAE